MAEPHIVISNATKQVGSNANLTVSVQTLGEHARFSVNQFISHNAKQGYKLTVYELNITNLDGDRQAGNATFFTLEASDGTIYQVVLNSLQLAPSFKESPVQTASFLK